MPVCGGDLNEQGFGRDLAGVCPEQDASCHIKSNINHYSGLAIGNQVTMTTTMTAANLQPARRSAIYPFILLSTYCLLVCQICRFASVADEVATHSKTRHRYFIPNKWDCASSIRSNALGIVFCITTFLPASLYGKLKTQWLITASYLDSYKLDK